MPDRSSEKKHPHPAKRALGVAADRPGVAEPRGAAAADGVRAVQVEQVAVEGNALPAYAELHCLSNFSFLRGASHPEELVEQAARLGYAAIAITDRNSLAGVVRAHVAAKECGLRLIIGAEITPADAPSLVLLAPHRTAYARLARLITRGRLRRPKGECEIRLADLDELVPGSGLIGLVLEERDQGSEESRDQGATRAAFRVTSFPRSLAPLMPLFAPGDLFLAAALDAERSDDERLAALEARARRAGVPLVATGAVHYHVPQRRYLQDVLTCIREKCTLATAGRRLFANAERHLRPRDELARRYAGRAALLERTIAIAHRCTFTLDELKYEYPHELVPAGRTAAEHLADLTWAGAAERYPAGIPAGVRAQLEKELALIAELRYEHYFLTVWDLVRFARTRGILCQGRGSAANSAACYCLGITAVDPARINLLFERFISRERNEPPDIDVDFEHERREEVFQYIYEKYGRERAAITAEVITYRPRSAVRDVGKALGLSLDRVDLLAKALDWWSGEAVPEEALRAAGLNPQDRTVQMVVRLVRQILGFPRHLSQHVGGFVITETPLCEMVPLENGAIPERTFIEWDKDDIDELGILKVDCLALGMLTAIGKCFTMLEGQQGTGNREQGTAGPRARAANEKRATADERRGTSDTERPGYAHNSGENGGSDDNGWRAASEERARLSRPDRLAESQGAGQGDLPQHDDHARYGALRSHHPDPPLGRIRSEQHRRGKRAPDAPRLPETPGDRTGFARRTRNAVDPGNRTKIPAAKPGAGQPPDRVETSASRIDRELAASGVTPAPAPVPCSPFPVPSSLHEVPPEDPAVYDMICAADTIGVFQIESRAQMSMLPRLKPRRFYDLVIEVAIVRPGPIQGGMIHPYLRRRDGLEPVTYPSDAIRGVLGKTLGVPLFQEQVMQIAVVAAGFTPGEADRLRRLMAAWRRTGQLEQMQTRLIQGMLANGYSPEFAEQMYQQVRGFGEYGFPESHAASFALLVYISAWLKHYHPAAFTAALLNSQPMGFYAPAQLVRDAQRHGVEVRPVDVLTSGYDCRLEPAEGSGDRGIKGSRGPALRLGFRLVRGLSPEKVAGVEAAQQAGGITSLEQLARRPDVPRETLLRLAAADAFRSLGLQRRQALWRILALEDAELPLFTDIPPDEPAAPLPPAPLAEVVVQDYDALGLSLTAHPLELVRGELTRLRLGRGLAVSPSRALPASRQGQQIAVAGLVTHRQRPGTAQGIVFMTLEDETGSANLIVRPQIWERDRAIGAGKVAVIAEGTVERQGAVIHVQVSRLHDLSGRLAPVRARSRDFH